MDRKYLLLIFLMLPLAHNVYADTASGAVIITEISSVTINNPAENSWQGDDFTVNVTIAGSVVTSRYRVENSSYNSSWTNMTGAGSIWQTTFDITSVPDGNYTLVVNASDAANNSAQSEVTNISIDDTPPTISLFELIQTIDTTTITVGETLTSDDFFCTSTDNSLAFGGTLATAITGIDTTSSGLKTVTCTVADRAGNSAVEYANYRVEGHASGGGSGGTTERSEGVSIPSEQNEEGVSVQEEIQNTIDVSNSVIKRIKLNTDPSEVDVKVEQMSSPTNPLPVKIVYNYFEINVESNQEIKSAIIEFDVPKEWFIEKKLDPEETSLYRYTDKWTELKTDLVNEDSSTYFYEAETPGFSIFAIASSPASRASLISGNIIYNVKGMGTSFSELFNNHPRYLTIIILLAHLLLFTLLAVHRHKKKPKNKRRVKR